MYFYNENLQALLQKTSKNKLRPTFALYETHETTNCSSHNAYTT